jgi:copper(I)-binding protein
MALLKTWLNKKLLCHGIVIMMSLLGSFITSAHDVVIEDAYVRESIPGTTRTSAYFSLYNTANEAMTLVGAHSPLSPRVELHEHTMANGMMRMREVSSINIDAQSMVTLQPSGLHIMMFDLKRLVKENENVAITLTFADHPSLTVDFPVRSIKRRPPKHDH